MLMQIQWKHIFYASHRNLPRSWQLHFENCQTFPVDNWLHTGKKNPTNKQTNKNKKNQQNTHTFRCINKIIMWSEPFSYLELLTMFMLTFICMITCCPFGWDAICAVFCFVCFYLYCRWSSKYQKGRDGIPSTA
jgi:hypothetical protein